MLIVQGSYNQATLTRRLWTACSTSSSTTTGTTWERCSDQNHCIHQNHNDHDVNQHYHCKITRMMFYRIAPLVSCRSPSFHQTVISSARKWLLGINPIKSTYHHPAGLCTQTIYTTIYHVKAYLHNWDPSWAFSNNLLWVKTQMWQQCS